MPVEIEIGGARVTLPEGNTKAERLDWANDYLWDFAEGSATAAQLRIVQATLIGYADHGAGREQYAAMARQIGEVLRGAEL